MAQIKEKTLFLYTVLNKNHDFICERNEDKQRINVYSWKFDFQTLNFIHNFCNNNSAYYSIKEGAPANPPHPNTRSILLTIDFI